MMSTSNQDARATRKMTKAMLKRQARAIREAELFAFRQKAGHFPSIKQVTMADGTVHKLGKKNAAD